MAHQGGHLLERECFEGYIKDALDHFYDPGHLQTSPLIEALVGQATSSDTAAISLRQLLREAIESLKPEESVPSGRREWLSYRLLWLYYIQSRPWVEVCDTLGLSRTSFYRSLRKALEAVASYLWRMQMASATSEAPEGAVGAASSDEEARAEATKVARASRRLSTSLAAVLEAAVHTIQPLLNEQKVTLHIDAPRELPLAYGDPAILRQILLNILAEGIQLAASDTLALAASVQGDETVWCLRGLDGSKAVSQDVLDSPGVLLSRSLLDVYGGRLWLETEPGGILCLKFAVPTAKPTTILVIDDNEDAILRYQRCLQPQGYALRLAGNGQEAQAHLAEALPDLILLDVLMPQEDGWDILQSLQTLPETMHIPVVICSVLSQPHLALALGAAEVLRKPITEETLLATIKKVLARADSGE